MLHAWAALHGTARNAETNALEEQHKNIGSGPLVPELGGPTTAQRSTARVSPCVTRHLAAHNPF